MRLSIDLSGVVGREADDLTRDDGREHRHRAQLQLVAAVRTLVVTNAGGNAGLQGRVVRVRQTVDAEVEGVRVIVVASLQGDTLRVQPRHHVREVRGREILETRRALVVQRDVGDRIRTGLLIHRVRRVVRAVVELKSSLVHGIQPPALDGGVELELHALLATVRALRLVAVALVLVHDVSLLVRLVELDLALVNERVLGPHARSRQLLLAALALDHQQVSPRHILAADILPLLRRAVELLDTDQVLQIGLHVRSLNANLVQLQGAERQRVGTGIGELPRHLDHHQLQLRRGQVIARRQQLRDVAHHLVVALPLALRDLVLAQVVAADRVKTQQLKLVRLERRVAHDVVEQVTGERNTVLVAVRLSNANVRGGHVRPRVQQEVHRAGGLVSDCVATHLAAHRRRKEGKPRIALNLVAKHDFRLGAVIEDGLDTGLRVEVEEGTVEGGANTSHIFLVEVDRC